MRWDLFCRVIDNFGDIGVCWRLARDLASRGQRVRLFADDTSALAWMAGAQGAPVAVHDWSNVDAVTDVADVVIEAFGCDPPPAFVRRIAARQPPPRWINLEYLSAEAYVERSHRLPSPQFAGPAAGLTKTFFFPGFTPATGGLLREPGLLERRAAFDRDAWLARRGWPRRHDEEVVLLFAYRNPALPELIDRLARPDGGPTLLLLAQGVSQQQALEVLARRRPHERLRVITLPLVSQDEFDHLLWSADLNFVRGEDSLVRAIWAGAPFVWQVYPQADRAHEAKLHAFLARMLAGLPAAEAARIGGVFRWWNGVGPSAVMPEPAAWAAALRDWRDPLARQDDLCTQLLREVGARG